MVQQHATTGRVDVGWFNYVQLQSPCHITFNRIHQNTSCLEIASESALPVSSIKLLSSLPYLPSPAHNPSPGLPDQDAPARVGGAAQLDVGWLIQRHRDAGGRGGEDGSLGGTGNDGRLGLV